MADDFDLEEDKSSGKGLIIGTVVILFLIAGVIAAFYFNVGGITDKYLHPILVEYGLAEPKEEDVSPYADWEEADFLAVIDEKQASIDALKAEIASYQEALDDKGKEIERLKPFEEEQLLFKQQKEDFDTQVVMSDQAPSITEYKKYYEMMYPEISQQLYREVVGELNYSQELKDYVKTYEQMDEKKAAEILSSVSKSDMDLVILILENSKADSRAKILENMTADVAGRISKSLAPVK